MCERQTTLINVVVQTCCVAVARSTVSKYNLRVMEALVQKIGIPPFPLDDEERLEELAQGFRDKSCGQLFGNVIGSCSCNCSHSTCSKTALVQEYSTLLGG